MSPGDDQGHEWRSKVRVLQQGREDVSLQVMHPDQGAAPGKDQSLCVTHTDE